MAVEQRFVFDQVAELYDRTRPGYPEALVDEAIARSGIAPGGRILEIGCGTGQATEAFARRGFRIRGLEPGEAMAERARARLARFANVEIAVATFEDWPLEAAPFDLAISAQAFHWVAPDVRFAKAAAALRAGGWLAVFGNVGHHDALPVYAAIEEAYRRHAPALLGRTDSRWYADGSDLVRGAADSGRFAALERRAFPWSHEYATREYLELLSTHSNHRLLPDAQRAALHDAIGAAIERHGGRLPVRYDAHLYLARRL